MMMTIDISLEAKARLEAEAARNGQEPVAYLQVAVENWFLPGADATEIDAGWNSLTALIERCQIYTGITDPEHRTIIIHGTPKREG